jgi:phytoene synthase
MNAQVAHWEKNLLEMARQALDENVQHDTVETDNTALIQNAYDYCEMITRYHSKTFYMASGLLPGGKKQAVHALYAFCRVTDDMVDRPTSDARSSLEAWKKFIRSKDEADYGDIYAKTDSTWKDSNVQGNFNHHLVGLAWRDTSKKHHIPPRYAEQLIDGVELDLEKNRYDSFHDLATYCYGVACTVGLMSMHIVGHSGPNAISYAIRLGVGLQLTNILRDVGEDWRNQRIYLPRQEMEAFGITEETIATGRVNQNWRNFMRYQINRARQLYRDALPGVNLLDRQGRFAIAAAAELYEGILDDIEAHDYQVFDRRSGISNTAKLVRLPGIWWRSNISGYGSGNYSTKNLG